MKLAKPIALVLPIMLLASTAKGICRGDWSQRSPAAHPDPRFTTAMAYDSVRNVAVLFGGGGGSNSQPTILGDTWEWDDVNWSRKSPTTSPSARQDHAMAYDADRKVTILFGGNFSNETWEWNGNTWTQRAPATLPPARLYHAMAFDSDRKVIVLYGGGKIVGIQIQPLGDTWEWDGQTWTQKSPITTPPALFHHSLCYDSRRHRTVLFGGSNGTTDSAETWEYDGATWNRSTSATSPPARTSHAAVFDSNKSVTVIFGGYDGQNLLGDTWQWDGIDWHPEGSLGQPGARSGHGMAYDMARRHTVLFGGTVEVNFTTTPTDETWIWSSPQPLITVQPADLVTSPGQTATFSLTALDPFLANHPPPLSFQWRKDGASLSDGGSVSGSTTKTLTINPVAPGDRGKYDCVVSACGQTFSFTASLDPCKPASAADDCNSNGIADACDIFADPLLDTNGDSVVDSCEPATPSAPDSQTTSSAQGSQSQLAAAPAPCGACGAGAATILPIAMIALGACRRSPR